MRDTFSGDDDISMLSKMDRKTVGNGVRRVSERSCICAQPRTRAQERGRPRRNAIISGWILSRDAVYCGIFNAVDNEWDHASQEK